MKKKWLANLGLIFITFLSAIQYTFLKNVPDSVSTFSFLCMTNLIGLVVLMVIRPKTLRRFHRVTLGKGFLLALELTGFNFFLLLGSRDLDSVVISSTVSMYFVFVIVLMLLLRQRVNFFASVATVIAIIGLLLMFKADTSVLFSSPPVVYLLIADVFFAGYVVSISSLGANEDSSALTMSQLLFGSLLAFLCWAVESKMGCSAMSLPVDYAFWISAFFIGVFIRALYGLIQIASQKHVSTINASLILSAEIIITLALDPILSRLLGTSYEPANYQQIVGCVLFFIATLLLDESITSRLGFADLQAPPVTNENGKRVRHSSVARKMIITTMTFAILTLVLSTAMGLFAIYLIRDSAVENSNALGVEAATVSGTALTDELESEMKQLTQDKAELAEAKLSRYAASMQYAAAYAHSLYLQPDSYPFREVDTPKTENNGKWVMQRVLANETFKYEDLIEENALLGNMVDVFAPIIENNDDIVTIYIGTESGLLISYDTMSGVGTVEGENYYDYRQSLWYRMGRRSETSQFTGAYSDSYGRGLTVTCVTPFYGADGHFHGCIAMDILVDNLNASMVIDGITAPNQATLLDKDGDVIAGKSIFSTEHPIIGMPGTNKGDPIAELLQTVLTEKDGILVTGSNEDAAYVAFATIDSMNWTLCVLSPVSTVIQSAITIYDSINENTRRVVDIVLKGVFDIIQNCLILSAVILLAATFFIGKFSRRVSDPLKQLERDVQEISAGDFKRHTMVKTNDEIGKLADSFNGMTDSLQKYMDDLKDAISREERIATELSLATRIQAEMLPSTFPAFPDRREFDIYATMTPAKEVGGDFYDFFFVDEDHLALVIADVSGKGIPAALFMAITMTLIKTRAQMGGTPSEILHDVNEQICSNNKEELFVTVWLAIVDLKTGAGIAANAGHEYPAYRHKDGPFELVKNKHSMALGTLSGLRFREHEFTLTPGDRLIVYTDGVPEATNAGEELFGEERLIACLNRRSTEDHTDILIGLRKDIDAFVGAAPQFDDLTIMCFDYHGPVGS